MKLGAFIVMKLGTFTLTYWAFIYLPQIDPNPCRTLHVFIMLCQPQLNSELGLETVPIQTIFWSKSIAYQYTITHLLRPQCFFYENLYRTILGLHPCAILQHGTSWLVKGFPTLWRPSLNPKLNLLKQSPTSISYKPIFNYM